MRAAPRDEVEAIVAVDDLFHAGKAPQEYFAELGVIIRQASPFVVVGLEFDDGSPAYVFGSALTEPSLAGEYSQDQEVRAILHAARDYFAKRASLDGYTHLARASRYHWVCLPLVDHDGISVGAFALAAPSLDLDDGTVAFMAFVARLLTRNFLDRRRAYEAERRAEEVAASARAAVEERDQRLSTVSHDLKNPLGVILMSVSALLDRAPRLDRRMASRTQVEAIARNANRMQRLVSDLLDFGSIEAGALSMSPRVCSPQKLVEDCIVDLMPAARAAGVALETALPATLPHVWADPNRIGQVLSNIVANALKFTPRGGRVVVTAEEMRPDLVSFAISDNGKGIAPTELDRVFEPYWQSPTHAGHGSGLGLAICRSLVELSGGGIDARSTLGEGTTITFTLPGAEERTSRPRLIGPSGGGAGSVR